MWSRLVIMFCFCLLITGLSSCPKKDPTKKNAVSSGSSLKKAGDKKVFFSYNQVDITDVSANTLLDIIEILQENPDAKVTLTGHTDNRGSHPYNLALGERRASAAKKFMIGCTPYLEKRIKTASKGETEPLVHVKDDSKNSKYEKDHAQNRRVEISFSGLK